MKLAAATAVVAVATLAAAAGCGPKAGIAETRMIQAPPLPATCTLQLVSVDITSMGFNQQWEVLGYVTLLDHSVQDPAAEENKLLVRPRACAMGGTAIAVALNSASTNQMGQSGSGLVYMVMHPKPKAATGSVTF